MPQWILLLGLAIAAWFVLALVGGILLGRLLGLAERRLPRVDDRELQTRTHRPP